MDRAFSREVGYLTASFGPISIVKPLVTNAQPEMIAPVMPTLVKQPTRVEAAGNKPKLIDEYVGRVNTVDSQVSIARMRSPGGWTEPGQAPEFDEYTIVLAGLLRVEHRDGVIDVPAGQAVVVRRGEWVRYSTPEPDGAEYIAVCLPAFSLDAAHRDPSS
jgi:mannose-6-phosphate isomerase-like protein (cupin superfamily)